MNDKSLKSKAIRIQGKEYVLVKDRVLFFNSSFPNGRIETSIISNEGGKIVMKAIVTPDVDKPERFFTGYSQANEMQGTVNKTSAVENCETSCVGRAMAMMAIGVLDSIASVDEINKAHYTSLAAPQQTETLAMVHESPQNEFGKSVCQRCGGPIAISKQGKPYCKNTCWLKDNVSTIKTVVQEK